MTRRIWRTLRGVLRCPATPVVLATVLVIDARGLAESTGPHHHSTVGAWLRGPLGLARRTGCWWPSGTGTVIQKPDGTIELQVDDATPIAPASCLASFRYSSRTSESGFYARTTRKRRASLSGGYSPDIERSVLASKVNEYIDYIAAHPEQYDCVLEDRASLHKLKSDANAYRRDPAVEYRSVSETEILWSGYLHNTLAAAPLLALLISTPWSICTIPGRIRRWRYKGEGRCNNCGYDITGVPGAKVCPECGATLNTPPVAADH